MRRQHPSSHPSQPSFDPPDRSGGVTRRAASPLAPVAALAPPFPLTPSTCERVAGALAVVERTDDAAVRELSAAVEACAAELHALGMASEAGIATIRAFVRHAAATQAAPGRVPGGAPPWVTDVFLSQIDRWCLAAYARYSGGAVAPPGESPRPATK
jgi:hypothetical protein